MHSVDELSQKNSAAYDALLVVSFGGPEAPDQVLPFLENVLRGRNVPRERMLEVAEHYYHFDGVSPINEQNRQLIAAVEKELPAGGTELPVYWGNRNWHPLLADTLQQMADDGIERALAYVTSAFSCYSGCRQYREDIARVQEQVGPRAPRVDKIRVFFNHPGFVEPMVEHVREAISQLPADCQSNAQVVYTAHSIPRGMADNCRYEAQLNEACQLVSEGVDSAHWDLVYQSRSGPPQQPWLEPDICEFIQKRHAEGPVAGLVLVPIGFLSDHMEVLFDLDIEARQVCEQLGIPMVRAATVGTHPRFVQMICELVEERLSDAPSRLALGSLGPSHDVCPDDCCPYTPRRPPT